jgi:ABC-type glycerol-3-phosphate transport system substrate-binding protein
METKNLSRRDFLRLSALTAAGLAVAPYVVGAPAAALAAPAAAPKAEDVVLDVMSLAEYNGPYKEIWGVFEEQNPGVKINVFSINEDVAAAYEARVAGGYLPAIELGQETQIVFKRDNYALAVDLSSIDFPWWDRWTFDVKNAWSKMFNLPGPRSLDCFQGYVMTWQYNSELMDKAGLNPTTDVKTMADMEKWLDEGTAWAKASGGEVDWFWNQAWHNWGFGVLYSDFTPLAYADGTRARQADCWLGNAKFNAEDSPYRHFYEFFLKAKDRGWIADNMPSRLWEGDMEASYIAGKSAMMWHGPWVWDKASAAGSPFATAGHQEGLPVPAPADGQEVWLQGALPPNIDGQWWMREGVQQLPVWPQIVTAWNWFWSPEAVPLKADAEGRVPLYTLDEPFDLKGWQYQKVLKFIGDANGPWPNTKFEQGWTGNVLAGPYQKKGSKGVFDWEGNGNDAVFTDLFAGKITVQQALDIAQKNWDESFEGLPDPNMQSLPAVPG